MSGDTSISEKVTERHLVNMIYRKEIILLFNLPP